MWTTIRACLGLVLISLAADLASADEKGHTTVPLDRVKAEVTSKKALLVDVRELSEWDKGHVRGAVLMPLSRLKLWDRDGLSDIEKAELARALPKGSVVYCHCAAGVRSLPGGEVLRKLGYDARSLKPGYKALIEAGFPDVPAK